MVTGLEQGRVMVLGTGASQTSRASMDKAGSKQGEQPWRSQGGRDRLAASTGVAAGDRVELDATRRVPAWRGCGFPMVNQTWREGRSSGEGDDRERKNRSFGKDVAHRCSIAR